MTQTSASPIAAAPTHNRSGEILEWLRGKIGELIRADPATINIELPFLEMGADSIVLIEAIRHIEAEYGVKLAMRRFFEDRRRCRRSPNMSRTTCRQPPRRPGPRP